MAAKSAKEQVATYVDNMFKNQQQELKTYTTYFRSPQLLQSTRHYVSAPHFASNQKYEKNKPHPSTTPCSCVSTVLHSDLNQKVEVWSRDDNS